MCLMVPALETCGLMKRETRFEIYRVEAHQWIILLNLTLVHSRNLLEIFPKLTIIINVHIILPSIKTNFDQLF